MPCPSGSESSVTQVDPFLNDVLEGLRQSPRRISPKYLYDERGSELFESICDLPEYYPTRTECGIMEQFAREMADAIGRNQVILELGSGSSLKTRFLLDAMHEPAAYVPFDISADALDAAVESLQFEYRHLEIRPLLGDFTEQMPAADELGPHSGVTVYFPGSTIGNLEPEARLALLKEIAATAEGGGLLIGIDLQKPIDIVEPAYDDAQGVTAAFTLNLLHRMNRELDADFDVDAFRHRARYNFDHDRIEIDIVAQSDQVVQIAENTYHFRRGETIRAEHCYKFTVGGFARIAAQAGLQLEHAWTDDQEWFAVLYLRRVEAPTES